MFLYFFLEYRFCLYFEGLHWEVSLKIVSYVFVSFFVLLDTLGCRV